LLGGEVAEGLLQDPGVRLAGTEGGGHDAVELGQAEELTQKTQPAGTLKAEDQVQGGDQTVEEGEARRTFEEACRDRVEVGVLAAPHSVLQGGTRRVVLSRELTLGGAVLALFVEELLQQQDLVQA